MANSKISALPVATTPLAGTEVLPVVQGGVTDQVSVANLTAGRAISALSATLSNGNLVVGTAGKGITTGGATALGFGVNSTVDAMTIDASKNIGVGTASPATKLDVNGGFAVSGSVSGFSGGEVRLGTSANTLQNAISTISTGTPELYFDHRGSNTGQWVWRSGTNVRMIITGAGDVGIATTPNYKLDVGGTFGFAPGASVTPVDNGDVVFELTNNTTLTVKAKGSDGVVRSATITLA